MKKAKNNIIENWLKKYEDKNITEQVKKEIKLGVNSPLYIAKNGFPTQYKLKN